MHEVFIKRSDLPVDKQYLIMHEYNCVLVDYHCHEQHGQTREFKLRCAHAQYKRYGREEIAAWVESLGLKQTVEIPEDDLDVRVVYDDEAGSLLRTRRYRISVDRIWDSEEEVECHSDGAR